MSANKELFVKYNYGFYIACHNLESKMKNYQLMCTGNSRFSEWGF
jgi:hypothetical protein